MFFNMENFQLVQIEADDENIIVLFLFISFK